MAISPERKVFLDPDGTWDSDWLLVVVQGATGVFYQNQCNGVATDEREVEGYIVPLGGPKFDVESGYIDTKELRSIFHEDDACYTLSGRELKPDVLERLRQLVSNIPFWVEREWGGALRERLHLDETRIDEIVEAWVPVVTPLGSGILMWSNCD